MDLPVPRLQLFEFNDSAWAGAVARAALVEALGRAIEMGRMLDGLVEPFQRFLDRAGTREVLDLGSGTGRPAAILAAAFRRKGLRPPRFLLTDLYPRPASWERLRAADPEAISWCPEPVDATRLSEGLRRGRARLVINAFHHFPPALARAVLRGAAEDGAPIFISEPFGRNPLEFLNFAPAGLAAMLSVPWRIDQPPAPRWLMFALEPLLVTLAAWDGVVSTLREYTRADLEAMTGGLGGTWAWEPWRYPPMGRGWCFHGVPGG